MESNSPSSSIDPDTFLGPEFTPLSLLPTFKIVGDNIDKEGLLHYFHLYAVKDSANAKTVAESRKACDIGKLSCDVFPVVTGHHFVRARNRSAN